jgi:hypothetical protein
MSVEAIAVQVIAADKLVDAFLDDWMPMTIASWPTCQLDDRYVRCLGRSRLILLIVSFSLRDPKETNAVS